MQNAVHPFMRRSLCALHRMTMDELVNYRKAQRAYAVQADAPLARVDWRALLHPLLYAGLRIAHLASGFRVTANGRAPRTRRPVIYAASHIGLYDVEAVLHAIRKHAYILSGDEEQMYRTLDGLLFDMNGVIYVDPEDSADKHVALQTAIRYLQSGRSLLWYPEGTWNLSPNVIIQPLYYGIIEAAYQSGALIVPVGLEQYDLEKGKKFIVNIGLPMDVRQLAGQLTKASKIELAETLRGEMAAMKLAAWENASRADIPDGYADTFVNSRLSEWPCYSVELLSRRLRKPAGQVTYTEAFEHLNHLRPSRENAFLIRTREGNMWQ